MEDGRMEYQLVPRSPGVTSFDMDMDDGIEYEEPEQEEEEDEKGEEEEHSEGGGIAARMKAFQKLRQSCKFPEGDAPTAFEILEESCSSPHTRPLILSPKKSCDIFPSLPLLALSPSPTKSPVLEKRTRSWPPPPRSPIFSTEPGSPPPPPPRNRTPTPPATPTAAAAAAAAGEEENIFNVNFSAALGNSLNSARKTRTKTTPIRMKWEEVEEEQKEEEVEGKREEMKTKLFQALKGVTIQRGCGRARDGGAQGDGRAQEPEVGSGVSVKDKEEVDKPGTPTTIRKEKKDKKKKEELKEGVGEEEEELDDKNITYAKCIMGPGPVTQDLITKRYDQLAALIRAANEGSNKNGFIPPKFPTTSIQMVGTGTEEVLLRLRFGAKQRVWERMSLHLLSQEEMMKFYGVLEKWGDRVPLGLNPKWFKSLEKQLRKKGRLAYDKYIDVPSFLRARVEMDPRIRDWLQMRHFLTFLQESDDIYFRRVPILHIFNYVMKKVWLKQTRLGFMNYDQHGGGYMTEEWLESYIRELLPTLVQLEGLDPSLEAFYLCTATRKFFFFLDPKRIGKIRIVDILASMLLDEILELRDPEVKESNWFSKHSMLRVYQHYLYLDRDENGMLSCDEFMRYNYSSNGVHLRLTRAFVEQLFNEKMTFRGEMDFRSYVDFVLAMENRREEASIAYFVRVMDLDRKGYLNAFDLHYFYKDVYKVLARHNPETPRFNDVKDEIFDMVRPAHPLKLTVKDLYKCGKGDLVLSMLMDAKGFDEYENREFTVPNNSKNNSSSSPPSPKSN